MEKNKNLNPQKAEPTDSTTGESTTDSTLQTNTEKSNTSAIKNTTKNLGIDACEENPLSPECSLEKNVRVIQQLGLPIGWDRPDLKPKPYDIFGWIAKFFGCGLTGIAISMGAPFWFDLLRKLFMVRSAVQKKE